VGAELRQIYLSGRRSYHPNDIPRPAKPNPNYIVERSDLPSPPPPKQVKEEETSMNADNDWAEKGVASLIAC
jgi:CO dehydrogenase/acetyl-CoA synthase delta subunit